MRASVSEMLDQPIEEVFAFVASVEHMGHWVNGVSEPRRTSEGPFGVGSTFASKYTYGNKTHDIAYVVTAHDPPTRHAVRSTAGPFPFEGVVTLEPVGRGTRITNTIDAGADSTFTSVIFVLFGPLVRMMMRQQLRKELQSLKAALTQDPRAIPA
jgi:hypothetical protein